MSQRPNAHAAILLALLASPMIAAAAPARY